MIIDYTISCKIIFLSKQYLIWMVNSYLLSHGCMQYIMFSQLTYKANYYNNFAQVHVLVQHKYMHLCKHTWNKKRYLYP